MCNLPVSRQKVVSRGIRQDPIHWNDDRISNDSAWYSTEFVVSSEKCRPVKVRSSTTKWNFDHCRILVLKLSLLYFVFEDVWVCHKVFNTHQGFSMLHQEKTIFFSLTKTRVKFLRIRIFGSDIAKILDPDPTQSLRSNATVKVHKRENLFGSDLNFVLFIVS